ncbi:hypothetical protein EJ05DRAFT_497139 [Pseudovirgaria hyperparasitica]|uniref:CFEM domain-containing protein n=1 Tax=Pseudovirgaria hyperparasitica TaxID=470096 RepID=A0A6A6WIW3_9PEZI|nr:uncharacterized protein EJ05DRAFT_497139 [Pseudovirgaria hyperparasitica]KAF2762279.1 hypothetical protein EJ05DRAFT_497139 [Pseudovirgaria hyperparasitica]
MKYSIALLAAVSAAVAQDTSALPGCGQTCIGNMVNIAISQFGCASGDLNCYCSKIDFGYGVRDCSLESCGSDSVAQQVIAYGTNYCSQVLASAGDGAASITLPGLSVLSSAAQQTGGEGSPASTPVTTSPLETTITSDGQTIVQTTGLVTLYGAVGGAQTTGTDVSGALSSALSEATGAVSSALSDASGAVSSVLSDASGAVSSALSDASSIANSATGGAPTDSQGAGPMITAAPVLAGAGLAAMLFI